jgi:hypothetical protein
MHSGPQKHIKAVVPHFPITAPAKEISDGMVNLGFYYISINKKLPPVDHPQKGHHNKFFPFPHLLT